MTREEWAAKGRELFGDDIRQWRFICPSCGHIASVIDYRIAGAPEGAIAYSCIGRWTGAKKEAFTAKDGGPCNYTGGGLVGINPVEIDGSSYFDFAPPQAKEATTNA